MEAKEARNLSDEELKKQLEAAHQEFFELRFGAATKQLKNHRDIPKTRKKIALLKTVMNERKLGIR